MFERAAAVIGDDNNNNISFQWRCYEYCGVAYRLANLFDKSEEYYLKALRGNVLANDNRLLVLSDSDTCLLMNNLVALYLARVMMRAATPTPVTNTSLALQGLLQVLDFKFAPNVRMIGGPDDSEPPYNQLLKDAYCRPKSAKKILLKAALSSSAQEFRSILIRCKSPNSTSEIKGIGPKLQHRKRPKKLCPGCRPIGGKARQREGRHPML